MTLEQACEFSGTIGDPMLASSHYKVGERVELYREIDHYPLGIFPIGATGVVDEANDDAIWIKMDRRFPELDDWQNRLQVWNTQIDGIQPEGTRERLGFDVAREKIIDDAVDAGVEAAFNALAAVVQNGIGEKAGDFAGQFFSGEGHHGSAVRNALSDLARRYLDAELAQKKAEGCR